MMHKIEIVNVTLTTLLLLYYIKFLALLGNTQVRWKKMINDLKGPAREILEKLLFMFMKKKALQQ